jgi:predicted nucleic acid-binding protein
MMSSGSKGESPARLVLDTSAYSRFRAGDTRVHHFLAAAEVVLLPATVLGELYGAFEFGSRTKENRVTLAEFQSEPFVKVVPTTADVARQYGRVYASLRKAGQPIPANDMWIAAAAIDQGACLLTFDRDFEHVAGLDRIILEGVEPATDDD